MLLDIYDRLRLFTSRDITTSFLWRGETKTQPDGFGELRYYVLMYWDFILSGNPRHSSFKLHRMTVDGAALTAVQISRE